MWKNFCRLRKKPSDRDRIVVTLALTLLVLGTGLIHLDSVRAAEIEYSRSPSSPALKNSQNQLPASVRNAVREDLSRRTRIPIGKLKVTQYKSETWPDGCLGLARADEFCTAVLVPGWKVMVSNGRQTWVYRTNESGSAVRLDRS